MSNIAVCVRFRPLIARETPHRPDACCIHQFNNESFLFKEEKEGNLEFVFDRVFYEYSSQSDVFEFVAMPIVRDAMNAINGTIITYGQTGAGKTFSMEGPNMLMGDRDLKGILPRVSESIFKLIDNADATCEFIIKLSMVEIYMEKIRDLLDSRKDNLQVKEDKVRGIFIAGATEIYIQSEREMLQLLEAGVTSRAVGGTQMNSESSRSHCVSLITIQQSNTEDRSVKTGKLFLVDLAGSEKVEKTGVEGKLLNEAKTINKSLSALGNVINALTTEKSCHVPYRDSKLTRILQESLGGNSRTTLLCCCSPSSSNATETLSTLRFGTRAKQIKNKPKINAERGRPELELLLLKSEQECEKLKSQLIMLNARLHSLGGDDGQISSNLGLAIQRRDENKQDRKQDCNGVLLKLKNHLSKKAPMLDDITNTLEDLFAQEGIIMPSYFMEGAHDCVGMEDDDSYGENSITKSLICIQARMKDLMENCEMLTHENRNLKTELFAFERTLGSFPAGTVCHTNSSGSACEGSSYENKARVLRPVRGGNHVTREATVLTTSVTEKICKNKEASISKLIPSWKVYANQILSKLFFSS
ncbi:hypothetical protein O6H91_04G121100 [Diphasiastrum complanatum]|uniref:Uncharacterized protein n=1 Tax=Diphasiastrum complanatum TaxID=34168 RepID=A0ACC2E177_DIPCM|nr:hypothetical protein O6H91_04G121100 [Diphasiastrum complanatum]